MSKITKIKAALHEEKQIVRDIVNERIERSDRLALRKIKSGGIVDRSDNSDTYIYGTAMQESRAYTNMDHEPRDLVAGDMEGRTLSGRNGLFNTSINDMEDNACHGSCEIPFAQGYRRRGFEDYRIALKTPTQCVRELDRFTRPQIVGYLEGMRNSFTTYGFDNFSDNLLDNVIRFGEANASVTGPEWTGVTKGGWSAPPVYRITIHFLQEYRRYLIAEFRTKNRMVDEGWKLEVEMPMEDWKDAVRAHNLNVNRLSLGGGATDDLTRYAGDILKDPEADMNGREFSDYGHIRCYFNEYPIRGYFRQSGVVAGKPNYNFVRVYPWKNEAGEEGGLVVVPNHDYDEDKIIVDGVSYAMCTLMPHIHPDSFTHYGFKKPTKTVGDSTVGVNYDVMIRDKSYIPDNDYNDKFRLVARHEYRWSNKYPEFSGFIAYRHGRRKGYVLEVVDRDDTPAPDEFATGMDMKVCDDITDASIAYCAQCGDGEVPEADGDCVTPAALADATIQLLPAGEALTGWTGAASTVRLEIRRTGEIAQASSVDITVAAAVAGDLAASGEVLAVAGTHFTAISATTLSWLAGERDSKFVDIAITGATGDTDLAVFKASLSNFVNAAASAGADVTLVKIEDLTV